MSLETEIKAAKTLLQRGVEMQVTAPLLFRMFGKKHIKLVITQPSAGTLIRMSELYLSTGIADSDLEEIELRTAMRLIASHGKTFSRIIATAYLNSYIGEKLFARILAKMILRLSPQTICSFVTLLFLFGGTEDFMTTIRSVKKMKITAPTLSQATQGS